MDDRAAALAGLALAVTLPPTATGAAPASIRLHHATSARDVHLGRPARDRPGRGRPAGIEAIRDRRGRAPAPPIAKLLDFEITHVERGRVIFALEPAEWMYNPLGSVHGGVASTLLDSALGCSVHTVLDAGAGYTTSDLHVRFVRAMRRGHGPGAGRLPRRPRGAADRDRRGEALRRGRRDPVRARHDELPDPVGRAARTAAGWSGGRPGRYHRVSAAPARPFISPANERYASPPAHPRAPLPTQASRSPDPKGATRPPRRPRPPARHRRALVVGWPGLLRRAAARTPRARRPRSARRPGTPATRPGHTRSRTARAPPPGPPARPTPAPETSAASPRKTGPAACLSTDRFTRLICSRAVTWWRDGVLYQIYPRSFADSDGDGIGDLRGIRARLDHLEWLGVDGIWLNPTMPSPNDDWGYDVADYRGVHPDLGTLEDLDDADRARPASAASGSCSTSSPTTRATGTRGSGRAHGATPHRDCYVWADPAPTAAAEQLGLDLRRLRRGRSTSRPASTTCTVPADAARPELVERRRPRRVRRDPALLVRPRRRRLPHRRLPRDRQGPRAARRPAGRPGRPPEIRAPRGVKQVYSMNRPEVHDVLRRWRALADASDPPRDARRRDLRARPRPADPVLRRRRDELQPRVQLPLRPRATLDADAAARDRRGRRGEAARGARGRSTPAPTTTPAGSPTRWAGGDPRRPARRCCMLLTLRGTPFLYYGDEIGAAGRRRSTPRPRSIRCAPHRGDPAEQPRPLPHADAVDDEPGGGFTRRRRRRGCRSATSQPQRRRPARRPATRRCT